MLDVSAAGGTAAYSSAKPPHGAASARPRAKPAPPHRARDERPALDSSFCHGSKIKGKPCAACAARAWSLCQPMADDRLSVVERFKSGNRMLAAGHDLLAQGEACGELFTVLDGWAIQYKLLEDGRRQITRIMLPGDLIGFQVELFGPSDHGVQALTDLTLCVFPRAHIIDLFRQHPELALRMSWLVSRDEARVREWLTNVGRRCARERVAYLLLELYCRVRMRSPEPVGSSIPLPLTQEHIGDALGLTSVHVNRTLRELRETGLVVLSNRTLHVLDPDRLAEVAGFEPELFDRL